MVSDVSLVYQIKSKVIPKSWGPIGGSGFCFWNLRQWTNRHAQKPGGWVEIFLFLAFAFQEWNLQHQFGDISWRNIQE